MVEVRPSLRRPVKNFALGRLDVRYGLVAKRVQEPVRDLRLISAGAANLIGKPTEESPHDLGERHTAEMLGGNPGALFQGLPFPQRPGTDKAGDSFRTVPPSVPHREAKQKVSGAAGAGPRVGVRRQMRSGAGRNQSL